MRVSVITTEQAVAQGITTKQLLACLRWHKDKYKMCKEQAVFAGVYSDTLWDMERHSWSIHLLRATINNMPDNPRAAEERKKMKGVRMQYNPYAQKAA